MQESILNAQQPPQDQAQQPQMQPQQGQQPQPQPQPQQEAPDPQMIQQMEALKDEGLNMLYQDEKAFSDMIGMFSGVAGGDPQAGGKAFSVVINSTLDKLEQQHGQMDDEMLASVGMSMMGELMNDLISGQILDVTPEIGQAAQVQTLQDWMSAHPDRVDKQGVIMAADQAGMNGQQPMQGAM